MILKTQRSFDECTPKWNQSLLSTDNEYGTRRLHMLGHRRVSTNKSRLVAENVYRSDTCHYRICVVYCSTVQCA